MKQSSAKSDLAKLFEKAGAPKFAVGGLSDTSLLSIAAGGVRPYYTQEEKDWLAAREREYADYNKAVEAYNQQVSDYQKQIDAYNESIKPYQSEVDAYNKALEDYNRGVEAYRKSLFIAEDNTPKVYERASNRGGWSGRVRDPITGNMLDPGQYYATLGDDNALIARQNPVATIDLTSQIYARGAVRYTDPRTGQVVYEGSISGPPKVTKDYMVYGGKLYEFEKTPGEFTAKMPGTPPAPFSAVAPTAPTNVPYTQEQVKQYSEAAKARAQKSAAQRSSALNVAASPEQYGLSGFGLSLPFKDGGEVSNEDFIQQMTVGTLPESKKDPSLFERYLVERQRRINELREAPVEPPKTFVYSAPGITGLPGYVIGNMLAKKLDLPKDVEEFFGHSKSRGAWNPEDLEEIRTRANGSPPEGEMTNEDFIQQMTVGTLPTAQEPSPADTAASRMLRALGETARGVVGAEALEPGSEAYRTGQALANMPGVALVAGAAKGAGKASKVSEVEKILRNTAGEVQAKRVQRAADEIPNLEDQFSAQALLRAFEGRKGAPYRGVVTIDPADFEKYATALQEPLSKHSTQNIEKLQWVLRDKKGFDEVPFLMIEKKGEPLRLPFVVGHEGRHRNRAMAAESMPKTLVEIMPRGELEFGGVIPEGKMTSEQWRELFNQKLKEGSGLVVAERIQKVNPEAIKVMDELYRLKTSDNPDYEKIAKLEEELLAWKRSPDYVQMDPVSVQKFPEVYAKGGPVTRANGSPPEGELSPYEQDLNQFITGRLMQGQPLSQETLTTISGERQLSQTPPYRSDKELSAYMSAVVPSLKVEPTQMPVGLLGEVRSDRPDTMAVNRGLRNALSEGTKLHELEHILKNRAVQGAPENQKIDNDIRFDRLYGDESGRTRRDMVNSFIRNKAKLEKFFGMPLDEYFNESTRRDQGRNFGAMFEEQIATLSALEQVTGKSITKALPDLFPDDKAAAVYDAITGLRQTRLDAKDLPPYTPQYKSKMDWIREKLQSFKK